MTAEVQVSTDGGHVRLAVLGEVDLANIDAVEAQVFGAISNVATSVSVDMTDVSYLDSCGLRMLFSLVTRLEILQIALVLVAPVGSPVRRVAELSGLASVIAVEPPADQAAC